jgi:hydroxyacylglutathione hydrolase
MKRVIFVFLLTIYFSFSASTQKTAEKCYQNINCADFNLFIEEKDPLILDVRLFKEYRNERIRNSNSATSSESLKMLLSNIDPNTYILVYCSEGDRSKTACEIICKELNFTYVFNLDKGIDQWKKTGYPVDKSRISTKIKK